MFGYRVFNRIKHIIKNTWNYFLYVCKNDDYDWDFYYLYMILKWKIDKMQKNIKKRDVIESADRVSKQMKYAIFLIDKLNNEDWRTDLYKEHKEKYGDLQILTVSKEKNISHCIFTYDKIGSPDTKEKHELLDKAELESNEIREFAIKKHEDYRRRLFKHLETYIEGWWD